MVFLNFYKNNITFLLLASICEILSSEVPRPRGVSLSRAILYTPDTNFACFDGTKTIPFTQVNDDYCDCLDASDEPGTSACMHGTFYCVNAGHKALNIASSRVNDGICDCCDGSDEYSNLKSCSNNCLELGRTAREDAQRHAELVKAGKQVRAEMSQKGVQLKQEKQSKLDELQKNKDEAFKLKSEKEQLKKEAEELESAALEYYRKLEEEEKNRKAEEDATRNRMEALETFSRFDSNSDGMLELAELKISQIFDKDKNGEVTDEEAKYFLSDQEAIGVEEFIEKAWSHVKPYILMDAGLYKGPAPETTENMEEGEIEHEQEDQPDDQSDDDNDEETEEEPTEEKAPVTYDDETQKLVEKATEARNEFANADKYVRDIENEIQSIHDYLEKDFGEDEEFAALEGQCFEYSDHEYIYRVCPFDKVTQTPKSGASETRLGVWGKWDGPVEGKYEAMLYERGQSCWNGPQRSTRVRVSCGSDNQVLSVSEPNRCEYFMDFITPAACKEIEASNEDVHDEL